MNTFTKRVALLFSLAVPSLLCADLRSETDTAASAIATTDAWPVLTQENKPWTFNWWMGSAVDKVNLGKELDRYRDAGLGGIHVIPIYSAKGSENRALSFLSPEWLTMFDWTIDEASKRGLGVDLTTGTGWCFGGPRVSEAEAVTKLVLLNTDFPADGKIKVPAGNANSASAARITWQSLVAISPDGTRHDLREAVTADGQLNWTPPSKTNANSNTDTLGWSMVGVGIQPTRLKVKRAGPGGEGYMLNPFDAQAMTDYLTPFRTAFAADSGHRRPRAMYHDSYEYFDAAWSPDVAAEFALRRGYKLQDNWDLFAGHGQPEQVARLWHDYRETISDLMIEKSFPVWFKWSAENGMLTRDQAHGSPANLLDLYALAQIPETEMFGHGDSDPLTSRFDANIGKGDRNIQVSKFASSAAHVAGRKLVSAETGTWMAEHFHETFEELKCFTDRLFVAGVNHIFYHGNAYSPDDVAWPGWLFYAATELNTRNPLWREFAALNHYVARVQSVLQASTSDNDFLLYFPIGDYWSNPKPGVTQLGVHERGWVPAVGEKLFNQGHAFDYVSDRQIAALKLSATGGLVAPGATYRTLVFPSSKTLPLETLSAALTLADQGATICLATPVADDVAGLLDADKRRAALHDILRNIDNTPDLTSPAASPSRIHDIRHGKGRVIIGPLEEILTTAGIAPEPAVRAFPGMLVLRKATPAGRVYFLVNQSLQPIDTWIPLGTPASNASALNPLTDSIVETPLRHNSAGQPEVRLRLEAGHSILLKTRITQTPDASSASADTSHAQPPARPGAIIQSLDTNWRVEFITGGPALPAAWEPEKLISWTAQNNPARDAFSGTARYTTQFDSPPAPLAKPTGTDLLLDLGEVAEVAHAYLNGHDLGVSFMRPHRVSVPANLLKARDNQLAIEVTNLGANRLRDLDRRGVTWKNFYYVNIRYKDLKAADWPLTPSGLLGPVTLRSIERD